MDTFQLILILTVCYFPRLQEKLGSMKERTWKPYEIAQNSWQKKKKETQKLHQTQLPHSFIHVPLFSEVHK